MHPNLRFSISYTTRHARAGEVDGHDYFFLAEPVFERMRTADEFLEYAEVFGHLYGTPKDKVDEALQAGKVVILEIDVQGATKARVIYPDAVMIFILAPSEKELAERLNHRGREADDVAEERLNGASAEIAAAWQYYKYMVINEDLQQAVNECVQIIENARTQT